ncbi:hypothetical protein DEU56DRAFT_758103 [Suillus clintonianus]|uniref:uncharacterized protein n=1 Tax=Suillus clintonianus TaxID=1904413 RepID=UPI001B8625C1|nr:uncharacterized protein DEU56DRAFT_758103 [Suillus clintonianus]KAG2129603.1 hypothetical protein DEU56DRAFT_758103 [Suillus clintonianus]
MVWSNKIVEPRTVSLQTVRNGQMRAWLQTIRGESLWSGAERVEVGGGHTLRRRVGMLPSPSFTPASNCANNTTRKRVANEKYSMAPEEREKSLGKVETILRIPVQESISDIGPRMLHETDEPDYTTIHSQDVFLAMAGKK